jgi:hypothetical protein
MPFDNFFERRTTTSVWHHFIQCLDGQPVGIAQSSNRSLIVRCPSIASNKLLIERDKLQVHLADPLDHQLLPDRRMPADMSEELGFKLPQQPSFPRSAIELTKTTNGPALENPAIGTDATFTAIQTSRNPHPITVILLVRHGGKTNPEPRSTQDDQEVPRRRAGTASVMHPRPEVVVAA